MDIADPNYIDSGELREQDRVPLDEYLADSDRAGPDSLRGRPFFSGREAEVSTFRRMVNAIALGRKSNATIAVEGPPGAGKSALLCQFLEELRALPPIGSPSRRWLPVVMDGGAAVRPDDLILAVDQAIARRLAQDVIEQAGREGVPEPAASALRRFLGLKDTADPIAAAKRVLDRGVSAFGFSIGAKGDGSRSTLLKVADLRERDWSDWQVALMLDEAQKISLDTPDADPMLLSTLHQGLSPLHMTFCAFGLPGTFDALADAGVSRLLADAAIDLRGLDDESAAKVVDRCFAQYGLVDDGTWRDAILARSCNWPQHLSAHLTAALKAVQARAGRGHDLGAPPDCLAQALESGDRLRSKYYNARLRTLTRTGQNHLECARHLLPMLRGEGGNAPESAIHDALGAPPLRLSAAASHAFLKAAKHSGLLTPGELPGTVHLAIPTFAGHVLGEAPEPLPEPARALEP
ncbi:MAG: ATP-binding protein [Gammaproteobacteria bacterium]|nr:ATP-binding protein [Gammaproteobacteria bacterium]